MVHAGFRTRGFKGLGLYAKALEYRLQLKAAEPWKSNGFGGGPPSTPGSAALAPVACELQLQLGPLAVG